MADKYFSVNRTVGYLSLRTKFEKSTSFQDGKIGYIIFSDTLANIGASVADNYVSKGYHVGFLTDTSDAAHAYACPNASFRAYLRGLATPINNLKKMIDATVIYINSEIGLSGNLKDFGLQWFEGVNRYMQIDNQSALTGFIPDEIGNTKITQSRSSVSLRNLHLTGSIPNSLGKLTLLESLFLDKNQLSGQLPSALGSLTALKTLSLSYNNLSGQIPIEWAGLTNIQIINLQSNNLSGTIPSELGGLLNLTSIDIRINSFTSYESGAISVNQTGLKSIFANDQNGTSSSTGLSSADVTQMILDVADNVLVNNQLNGYLWVQGNFPPTAAAISDPIVRFGNISAKAFLQSKGWDVRHS